MSALPPFAVTSVGSWPRTRDLLRAQRAVRRGEGDVPRARRLEDQAVLDCLRAQERAGVDVVGDGEQRRDNFYSFVADKLDGVRLMTLREMLDVVEDKASFEQVLQTLDVPAFSLSNPTCVGPIARREPLAGDELRFLQQHTDAPIKIALPGPYLLTRAMYVKEVSRAVYTSKEDLGDIVVALLRAELLELLDAGAHLVQFDEPVLTEVVFTQGQTRTFMCAALSAKADPSEELAWALDLIRRVTLGVDPSRTALHVCRGNWSRDESILLTGNYHPLKGYLEATGVGQLVLEYATERAGDLMRFGDKALGLGVVNPRTDDIEPVDQIVARAEQALELYAPAELSLNPDCGFACFSNSPVNSQTIAEQKLATIAAAARALRERH